MSVVFKIAMIFIGIGFGTIIMYLMGNITPCTMRTLCVVEMLATIAMVVLVFITYCVSQFWPEPDEEDI